MTLGREIKGIRADGSLTEFKVDITIGDPCVLESRGNVAALRRGSDILNSMRFKFQRSLRERRSTFLINYMKKLRFGDVVEIPTSKGFSYAMYTHKNEKYGHLIRVFDGFYVSRPEDLSIILNHTSVITVFFPLGVAVNRTIFEIVGNLPIPSGLQVFPIFRWPDRQDFQSGKVYTWSLWDGSRTWDVGKLTSDQKKLPIMGIVNDTLLIQRIEEGWTPETDTLTNR